MNAKALLLHYRHEYLALRFLSIGIALLVVVYCYAVTATIFNIASLKSLEDEVRTSRAQVGTLESQYLAKERELSYSLAGSMGLSKTLSITHVSLDTGRFSLNTNDEN